MARKDLSDTTVAAFTRQLFAIRQSVMSEFPLAGKIETPDKQNALLVMQHTLKINDEHPDYPAMVLANYMVGGTAGAPPPPVDIAVHARGVPLPGE